MSHFLTQSTLIFCALCVAVNVFFHLTYENAVDIDAIKDPTLREATVAQIEHFGQTPSQLLTKAHPARAPAEDVMPSVFALPLARLKGIQLTNLNELVGRCAAFVF